MNRFAFLVFMLSFSVACHAISYDVGSEKINVSVPAGFFSLKEHSESIFISNYANKDSNQLDFYCYEKAPESVGACNFHRTLSIGSPKNFSALSISNQQFTAVKENMKSNLNNNCNICLEKSKSDSNIKNVEMAGIFAYEEKYIGHSLILTYQDHKSIEATLGVLVKGKLILIHARSNVDKKSDIKWANKLLVEWAKRILAENG